MIEKKTIVVRYYQELSKKYDEDRLSTEKSKIISYLQNEWFVKNLENTYSIDCLEIGWEQGG